MKIFYFTATGNSLYVAKRIGGELYSIPQVLKEGKYEFEDEAIGFIYPCYVFGMPRIVREFIKKSKFKADYFFSIMTYGHDGESGLRHIEQAASQVGITFDYTNEILMVDNYLSTYEIGDELQKEDSKKIEENLDKIINDIKERKQLLTRKGIKSIIVSKTFSSLAGKFIDNFGYKNFVVNDNCSGCKICQKVCPASNIKVSGKPEFYHKCEMCLACIHHCPQNAIHLRNEKSKARFINQNVKLKEIIASNE